MQDRLVTLTNPDSSGLEFTTNVHAADGLEEVTDAERATITYTRDGMGRVATATDDQSNVTSYEYNHYGQVTKMTEPGWEWRCDAIGDDVYLRRGQAAEDQNRSTDWSHDL